MNNIDNIYIFNDKNYKYIIKLILYISKFKNELFSLINIILINWYSIFENNDYIIIYNNF